MSTFVDRFNQLPELLKKRSMSDISRDINFTATTVNNIARGVTKPGFDVLQSIAKAYPQLILLPGSS